MSALIVAVELAPTDLAWFDRLRRAHYPAERNQLRAHLTMFHALPPSAEEEARRQLAMHCANPPPRATVTGLMDLGGGVAFRIASDALDSIREALADHFHGMLSAQDAGGWRPHITIQNKVAPKEARELKATLEAGFRPRPLGIRGLSLNRYLVGPWERIAGYQFRTN